VFADLERLQLLLLKGAQVGEQIEGNPEPQKTAQAIAKRDEQFAQQVAVKQTHLCSRVAKRPGPGDHSAIPHHETTISNRQSTIFNQFVPHEGSRSPTTAQNLRADKAAFQVLN